MVLPDGTRRHGQDLHAAGRRRRRCMHQRAEGAWRASTSEMDLIPAAVIEPISHHEDRLPGHSHNPRLHSDEMLIALSISSGLTNPLAARLIEHVRRPARLRRATSASSSRRTDAKLYRTLGINVVLRAQVRAAPLLPQVRQGLRGGWPLAPRMVPPGQGSPAGPLPGRPPGSPSRAPNCRPKNAPQKLRRILGATICMAKLVVAKTGTKPSVPRPPCRQLAPSSDARRTTST